MNQSKLETRPSRRRGTNRCFVVAHTIVPAASKALNAKQAAAICQWDRRKPVAGDRERRQRPCRVDEGHVPTRRSAVRHEDRREDGSEPAGGEYQTQIARAALELVLDHEGQQHV